MEILLETSFNNCTLKYNVDPMTCYLLSINMKYIFPFLNKQKDLILYCSVIIQWLHFNSGEKGGDINVKIRILFPTVDVG